MEMFIPVRSNMEREPNIQGHLEMANVYSYWLECADGRWAAAWRDIDIMSLPASMLQYVAVCYMTEDGDFSGIGGVVIRRITARITATNGLVR